MRKLVTIRKVRKLLDIKGADFIQLAMVDDWSCIVKKGEFVVGDLAVYFEVDSLLPEEPRYEFLAASKREYFGSQKYRLKTMKMRGVISQGLALPLSMFPEVTTPKEGDDVTDLLGIIKYDPQFYTDNGSKPKIGNAQGRFPSFIPKTDQERIQNLPHYYELYRDHLWEETLKLDGCFLGNQYIETWDGDTVNIRDIVSKGIRPKLIGVDESGNVVPCEVTNVFDNGTKSDWVDIHYSPYLASQIVGKSGKIRTTPSHKFFLADLTEIPASSLTKDSEILMQAEDMSDSGLHYIRSALLGDGCIGTTKHFAYNECHYTKADNYNNYVLSLFPSNKTSTRVQTSGYGSEVRHIKVFSTPSLKKLRSEWYGPTGKRLPEDIDWIDDFTIAKWYIDDGSLGHSASQNDRANFATNAFSEEDTSRLADKLRELYGVSVTTFYSKGWCIRVNYADGSINRMWEAIAPHIHDFFLYKLPEHFRDRVFINYPITTYSKLLVPVKVLSVTPVAFTKKNFPNGSKAFDIETTTHNYFCGGVLVHNSSLTVYKIHKDLTRWQRLKQFLGFSQKAEHLGVCSRNLELKPNESFSKTFNNDGKLSEFVQSDFWRIVLELDISKHLPVGYALQGELIGPKIQANHEKVSENQFWIFDVYDITEGRYLLPMERSEFIKRFPHMNSHVPVVEYVKIFTECPDFQALQKRVTGQSINSNTVSEGRVYKSCTVPGLSFKCISNDYLLKNDD